MTATSLAPPVSGGATSLLAARAAALAAEGLDCESSTLVGQALVDYLGVALAGTAEPAAVQVRAELTEDGGRPVATVLGDGRRLPARAAALANGTAAHALDYDDVHLAMPGHPGVALWPALLALGEQRSSSGRQVAVAYAAGHDVTCALGTLLDPGHYDCGFHPTATLGAIGAAVACGVLMKLDATQLRQAIGIAATQAAGLKAMFGTMCKPLHAGTASATGLWSARLAARGFAARDDAIEAPQGFAATHAPTWYPERLATLPLPGAFLRGTLYKYHAACYLTHSTLEACRQLRTIPRFDARRVRTIRVHVDRRCRTVCHIEEPRTGLEAKFSLRMNAALGLLGRDTAALTTYSDEVCLDPDVASLLTRVEVCFESDWPLAAGRVDLEQDDGVRASTCHDASLPSADLAQQRERLAAKFYTLATPMVGSAAAAEILATAEALPQLPDVGALLARCAGVQDHTREPDA